MKTVVFPEKKKTRGHPQYYYWMLVTSDKYQLPLQVCDTVEDLAEYCKVPSVQIRSMVCHAEKRKGFCKYVRIFREEFKVYD